MSIIPITSCTYHISRYSYDAKMIKEDGIFAVKKKKRKNKKKKNSIPLANAAHLIRDVFDYLSS